MTFLKAASLEIHSFLEARRFGLSERPHDPRLAGERYAQTLLSQTHCETRDQCPDKLGLLI